jgi:hypothetical protein
METARNFVGGSLVDARVRAVLSVGSAATAKNIYTRAAERWQ